MCNMDIKLRGIIAVVASWSSVAGACAESSMDSSPERWFHCRVDIDSTVQNGYPGCGSARAVTTTRDAVAMVVVLRQGGVAG